MHCTAMQLKPNRATQLKQCIIMQSCNHVSCIMYHAINVSSCNTTQMANRNSNNFTQHCKVNPLPTSLGFRLNLNTIIDLYNPAISIDGFGSSVHCAIQLLEYTIPPLSQKPRVKWISGTERAIINPLVSK